MFHSGSHISMLVSRKQEESPMRQMKTMALRGSAHLHCILCKVYEREGNHVRPKVYCPLEALPPVHPLSGCLKRKASCMAMTHIVTFFRRMLKRHFFNLACWVQILLGMAGSHLGCVLRVRQAPSRGCGSAAAADFLQVCAL